MIFTALLLVMQAQAAAPAAKPVPDPAKRICRREMPTGSNMSRSVCHTRAEWDAIGRAGGDAAERLRGPSQVRPNGT